MKTSSVRPLVLLVALAQLAGCATAKTPSRNRASRSCEPMTATLLQLNDVYEINGVGSGMLGGLDRVATLRDRLKAEDPSTLTILPGDFLNPTALNLAKVDGKRIAGKPMTHVLNAMGVDLVTYGNHEFDLKPEEMEACIEDSRFRWITTNVTRADGTPWPKTERTAIVEIEDPRRSGCKLRVGFLGVTLPMAKPHVAVTDPIETLRAEAAVLRPQVDVLVALTHLPVKTDRLLAEAVPAIDLIAGGHDHDHMKLVAGEKRIPITKADSNAKTVFVHRIRYDFERRSHEIDSQLVPIDPSIPSQARTADEIARWRKIAFESFAADGFEAEKVLGRLTERWDGDESLVRSRSTPIVTEVAKSFLLAGEGIDIGILDSGLVRLDDQLEPGPITQYDVLRILPFGDKVEIGEVPGKALIGIRDGSINVSDGRYIAMHPEPELEAERTYRIASTGAFLARLKKHGGKSLSVSDDARKLFIRHLEATLAPLK